MFFDEMQGDVSNYEGSSPPKLCFGFCCGDAAYFVTCHRNYWWGIGAEIEATEHNLGNEN